MDEDHENTEGDERDYREESGRGECIPMGDGKEHNRKPNGYEDNSKAYFPRLDQLCASFMELFP
jgi:hypothetical protein